MIAARASDQSPDPARPPGCIVLLNQVERDLVQRLARDHGPCRVVVLGDGTRRIRWAGEADPPTTIGILHHDLGARTC